MEQPLLTVIVPVYNHEHYVEECIRSVWQPCASPVEIVAIDDGSVDTSFEVLRRLQGESPVPMRIEHQENMGLTRTANRALALARGKYVLVVASDDKLVPGALSRALPRLEAAEADFAIFNAVYFGDATGPVYQPEAIRLLKSDPGVVLHKLYVEPPKPLLLQSTVIGREFLVGLGGWNEALMLDDWPVFIRLFEQANKGRARWVFEEGLCLAAYRLHGSNAHKNLGRQVRMCEEVIQALCPADLRPEALVNTYVSNCMSALRRGQPEGMRFLGRAIRAGGLWRVLWRTAAMLRARYGRRHRR